MYRDGVNSMQADLYVVYRIDYTDCIDKIEVAIFNTSDEELANMVAKKHSMSCEVKQYSDMTNITNPCSMAYYDKMEHEKNLIIKELKEELEQKDKRIYSLNETIVRLTNLRGD